MKYNKEVKSLTSRQRNGHEFSSLRNIILDLLLRHRGVIRCTAAGTAVSCTKGREAFAAIRIGHHPLFLQKAIEDENALLRVVWPSAPEC